jgi:hypothetical protein
MSESPKSDCCGVQAIQKDVWICTRCDQICEVPAEDASPRKKEHNHPIEQACCPPCPSFHPATPEQDWVKEFDEKFIKIGRFGDKPIPPQIVKRFIKSLLSQRDEYWKNKLNT